jgi:hypothetical protein
MRPIISSLALAALSLLASACGGDGSSGPPGLERFDATLPGTTWAEATGGRCPALTVTVTGPGQATPGGDFTISGSHCLSDPASADSFDVLYPKVTDGQFAFTFASGATVTGTYEGNLVLKETGLYGVIVDFWFTGGTGEFAHPGGGASVVDLVNDSTPGRLDRQTGQATKLYLSGAYYP